MFLNGIRIFLIAAVLIGGTALFGFWALHQFDLVFANISSSYASPAATGAVATSSVAVQPNALVLGATSTPKFAFTFPLRGITVYSGCAYTLSWLASTTIKSLDISLVDAGTLKPIGPLHNASTSTTASIAQGFQWKVRRVWPGNYYLLVSSINGIETKKRSGTFTIGPMPETGCAL